MSNVSNHYYYDRRAREAVIKAIGEGEEYKSFEIDKGHVNGAEIHIITTTAIVKIYNAWSGKLITKIIAKPGRIKRYFEGVNEKCPKSILNYAYEHRDKGYCLV